MANKGSHLDNLFDNIDPERLDRPCEENHLNTISDSILRWEELAPDLDLSAVDIEDIKETKSAPKLRRRAMLKEWKQKFGKQATYRKLARILVLSERRDVAEKVCEMASHSSHDSTLKSVPSQGRAVCADIAKYGEHLRGIYQTELRYSLDMDSLPSPTPERVFNLVLIPSQRKVQYGTAAVKKVMEFIRTGEVEEVHDKEVKLENIFRSEQLVGSNTRKFILFEGASGVGKSTLACFICQKWGAKELFQEFSLVIFVQLNDPAIQSAQSLADIFHSGSRFDTQQIASHLQTRQGEGVLFILDGWDKFFPKMKEGSLLDTLLCAPSTLSMHLSAVIVTSRPIASGKLQRYCSTRIQIIGFKPDELKHFFEEALDNDHRAVAKLEQCLKEKPLIKKSCFLPLNATIVAHTFLASDESLPATIYDLFDKLVCTAIELHMKKLGLKSESTISDKDFLQTLPPPFQSQLNNLSKLAYDGVVYNETTFSDDDLKSHGISSPDSMLSLLHGVPSFAGSKRSTFYQFRHVMVQEFLATMHILQLPLHKQFEAFQPLFDHSRFVACFQLYISQADYENNASKFCSFFAHVFKEIRSRVDIISQRSPKKWQGTLQQLRHNPKTLLSEYSSADPASLPQPLSSLNPIHIVLYFPLPFFDIGFVLISLSITPDEVPVIECDACICIGDDVMMYGHLTMSKSAVQVSSTHNTAPSMPYLYNELPLESCIKEIFSDTELYEKLMENVPKGFLKIKDCLILKAFISCIFSVTLSDVPDYHDSHILCFGNMAGEVQVNSEVYQQCFHNLSEQCQMQ